LLKIIIVLFQHNHICCNVAWPATSNTATSFKQQVMQLMSNMFSFCFFLL